MANWGWQQKWNMLRNNISLWNRNKKREISLFLFFASIYSATKFFVLSSYYHHLRWNVKIVNKYYYFIFSCFCFVSLAHTVRYSPEYGSMDSNDKFINIVIIIIMFLTIQWSLLTSIDITRATDNIYEHEIMYVCVCKICEWK
jgi:hypothetical protein